MSKNRLRRQGVDDFNNDIEDDDDADDCDKQRRGKNAEENTNDDTCEEMKTRHHDN